MPPTGFNDYDLMVGLVERTPPFWEPGTRAGYHSLTMGWLVGELVRRVSGRTVGTFFREEVAEPLGLDDVWIGPPQEHETSCVNPLCDEALVGGPSLPSPASARTPASARPATTACGLPSVNGGSR